MVIEQGQGQEYCTTTGGKRKANWLNLNMLIDAINISGTTDLIISKIYIKYNKIKLFGNITKYYVL